MKSVAFLGAKTVGFACLEKLVELQQKGVVSIDAVFTNLNRNVEVNKKLIDYAASHNLKVYDDIDDILRLDKFDFIISVQYHKILKAEHIARAKELAINLHMAALPEFRGCNQFSYAIINGAKEFGTTLHVINEKIDNGDMIVEKRFAIPENCFVNDLYELTLQKSIEMFNESIEDILNGKYTLTTQDSLVPERGTMLGFRKDIDKLKQIDLNWGKEKIEAHIRGTLMPDFEPPYFMIGDKKIYVSANN